MEYLSPSTPSKLHRIVAKQLTAQALKYAILTAYHHVLLVEENYNLHQAMGIVLFLIDEKLILIIVIITLFVI